MSGLQLLAPLGLLALIGIPLVVFFHMRHTTPVERAAPTLRFWKQVTPTPTDEARLRRPPISLLLLLQLLAVGALALALARPAVADAWAGLTQRTEPAHLIVLLDGSTSVAALDTDTSQNRFDAARKLALQRIAALHEGDAVTMLVLGSSVQSFEAADSGGMRTLTDRLRALPLPGGRADLNDALSLAGNLILPDMDNQVVVITDGAVSADPAVVAAVNAPIELLGVGRASEANLAVVALNARASADNANKTALFARLANFGGVDVNASVAVLADGVEVQTASVSIPSGDTVDFTSDALPAGVSRLQVRLSADDVLPADDSAQLVLSSKSDLAQRILLVSDTPLALQRALSSLPGAQVTSVSTTEHLNGEVPGGPFDLLVFENYTPASAADIDAPALFVHPPVDGLLPATGVMTTASVQYVRAGDPLLKGVDLTGMEFGETPILPLGPNDTAVVEGESGPLLYRGIAPGGSEPIIVLAVDLQESVLPQRLAFPILMANAVRALAPAALPASAVLGDPLLLQPRTGAETIRITSPSGVVTDIPVSIGAGGSPDPAIYSQTGEAGEYTVQELDSADAVTASGVFVINAGHPVESNLTANPDLPSILAAAHASPDQGARRERLGDLWPFLAALALGALAVEWLWASSGAGTSRGIRLPKGART